MKREGHDENGITRPGGVLKELFELPADILDGRTKDGFTYPVAIYDHDEGEAVTAGFAYYGRIAPLYGRFVLGDIVGGRLFAADIAAMKKADDGIPQTVAPVEEIQLYVRDDVNNRTFVTLLDPDPVSTSPETSARGYWDPPRQCRDCRSNRSQPCGGR